jgi:hypothetical protein
MMTDDVGRGFTVVDSTSTPDSVDDCDSFSHTTDATGICNNSTSSIDLSPGDGTITCPVFLLPVGTTIGEIQFDASAASESL